VQRVGHHLLYGDTESPLVRCQRLILWLGVSIAISAAKEDPAGQQQRWNQERLLQPTTCIDEGGSLFRKWTALAVGSPFHVNHGVSQRSQAQNEEESGGDLHFFGWPPHDHKYLVSKKSF